MWPRLALLLVAPLLACFTDISRATESGIGGTTGSGEPGTSGAPVTTGEPGTSGEPGPGSTQAGTDTSTGAPTTGVVDECAPGAECQPGAVETGELCDSCGVQRRTCQPDCTWSAMACEQDLDTCAFWRLPAGEQVWQRVAVDPGANFAPKEPVLAALALAPQKQIYVLTATSYHVLSTVDQTWIGAGARASVLPEIADRSLVHGTSLTVDAPDTIVSLVVDEDVFGYDYVAAKNDFVFTGQVPCCGANWIGANAPDPYAVRAGWGRLGDPEGWIPGDLQALCDLDEPTQIYGYNLSIGDGFVYPQDIGHCFDFYPPIPYEQFTPFTYPGAPANALIRGAAWAGGLWIFR